jgi:hypothetical protein
MAHALFAVASRNVCVAAGPTDETSGEAAGEKKHWELELQP